MRQLCCAQAALRRCATGTVRCYSVFPVNLPTGQPAHGPPRGLLNRMAGLGLPPWAAWCKNVDQYAIYRMGGVTNDRGFLPKHDNEMDGIWMNERVRERVRTTRKVQFLFKQLKYPWMKTGIWYSDTLDHWVQVPHVHAAHFAIEQDGGFDNFILKRTGRELKSRYGERIRRHILVRQREVEKNFVLQEHASKLASVIQEELNKCNSAAQLATVLQKYGLDAGAMRRKLAPTPEIVRPADADEEASN